MKFTPLRALGILLGWNYSRHLRSKRAGARRQLSTVCSEGRELIPLAVFLVGWPVFNAWFVPHWVRGYKSRHLTN